MEHYDSHNRQLFRSFNTTFYKNCLPIHDIEKPAVFPMHSDLLGYLIHTLLNWRSARDSYCWVFDLRTRPKIPVSGLSSNRRLAIRFTVVAVNWQRFNCSSPPTPSLAQCSGCTTLPSRSSPRYWPNVSRSMHERLLNESSSDSHCGLRTDRYQPTGGARLSAHASVMCSAYAGLTNAGMRVPCDVELMRCRFAITIPGCSTIKVPSSFGDWFSCQRCVIRKCGSGCIVSTMMQDEYVYYWSMRVFGVPHTELVISMEMTLRKNNFVVLRVHWEGFHNEYRCNTLCHFCALLLRNVKMKQIRMFLFCLNLQGTALNSYYIFLDMWAPLLCDTPLQIFSVTISREYIRNPADVSKVYNIFATNLSWSFAKCCHKFRTCPVLLKTEQIHCSVRIFHFIAQTLFHTISVCLIHFSWLALRRSDGSID